MQAALDKATAVVQEANHIATCDLPVFEVYTSEKFFFGA